MLQISHIILGIDPLGMTPNEVGRSIHLSRMTSSSRCLSSYSDRHASAPQQPSPFAVDLSRVLRLGRTAGNNEAPSFVERSSSGNWSDDRACHLPRSECCGEATTFEHFAHPFGRRKV
jgi:hypothetical protein